MRKIISAILLCLMPLAPKMSFSQQEYQVPVELRVITSMIDVEVPLLPEIVIDNNKNIGETVISPDMTIKNKSEFPIDVTYLQGTSVINTISSEFVPPDAKDWSKLTHKQACEEIAVGMVGTKSDGLIPLGQTKWLTRNEEYLGRVNTKSGITFGIDLRHGYFREDIDLHIRLVYKMEVAS